MPQIPAGWKETTLGNLIYSGEIQIKNFLRKPISSNERSKIQWEYPYYWAASSIDSLNSFSLEGLHLLIAEDWTVVTNKNSPMLQLVDGKFNVSNHAHILQGNDNQKTRFLYYLLSNVNVLPYITWAVQPKLSKENLLKICFLIPESLPEQQAIAAVLSSFDDKIELLRAENQTLEQMGQELFKERFGKWKVGDELPEGWRVGKLSEIADFLNGLPLQKYPANEWEESLPVIKIREMKSWITDQTGRASVDIDQKYIVQDWDVLFSRSGSLELVFWEYWPWALNQHLFKVTSSNYPKRFYYYWILYHLSEFRVIANTKATTMGHIQRGHLDLAKVMIPDSESLIAFDKVMSKIIQKLLDNKGQIQILSATRDQLLPKLMSGEVRVEF